MSSRTAQETRLTIAAAPAGSNVEAKEDEAGKVETGVGLCER